MRVERLRRLMIELGRIATLSLVLSFMLAVVGCDSGTSPCVDTGPESSLEPIDGRINFYVAERHDCPGDVCEPSIMLLMQTEKMYPCSNYLLVSQINMSGKLITVDVDGVYIPEICLTAPWYAHSSEVLALAPGEYSLRILLGCDVDSYDLDITKESIEVRKHHYSTFTTLLAEQVWRYPHNSFCYLCGTTVETSWMCDAFLDSLLSADRFEEFRFPDGGLIPYSTGTGGYHHNTPARYFRYANEADYDTAGALLERFAKEVTSQYSGVGLSLWGWNDKRFLSWRLEDETLKGYPKHEAMLNTTGTP